MVEPTAGSSNGLVHATAGQEALFGDGTDATAVFSACGTYRYHLSRTWDPGLAPATFLMLNPSTATHEVLDPTVRRCVGFAKAWGCGGLVVVNAYAFRSTDPAGLWDVDDPVGPDNDDHLADAATSAATADAPFVIAWGVHARPDRVATILRLPHMGRAVSLGVTKDGHPRHPLYVRADTPPGPWPPATPTL